MKICKKGISASLAVIVLLTACAGRMKSTETDTPEKMAEQVMRSVKELDLETFNAYTDNYEGSRRGLFGLLGDREYKVFQDILQPHIFESRRYKEKRRFAEKVVEELEWDLGEVREEDGGEKARIKMTVTNRDMAKALELYIMWIMEDIMEDTEMGALSLIKDIPAAVNGCNEDLIRFIDETRDTWTEDVTVTAYKEDGVWKLHLTDEFINALMGNMDPDEYEDEWDRSIDGSAEETESEYARQNAW